MSAAPASALVCAGCGAAPAPGVPPFRCPAAGRGDDADHVLARRLDLARVRFPEGGEGNPFVRYRDLLHSYHLARAEGLADGDHVALVERLDRAVAAADGRGFGETPFARAAALGERLGFGPRGGVWVKDETGNVAGSHKARHLVGVALTLETLERLGRLGRDAGGGPRLAIASCGNAALAAAVVARAAGRPLDVFVPPDAEAAVLARLERLGARIAACPREAGARGDPCVRSFRAAVAAGALPFTCQGSENGLVIEGGETLGYEMVSALAASGTALDRLFVQAGGGALASACVQAFREAVALGACPRMPRIHAVQARGCHPLARAHDRLTARILHRVAGGTPAEREAPEHAADPAAAVARRRDRAARLLPHAASAAAREELRRAATRRSEFMWAWEETPRSVARGILDDETYDWLEVVSGMIETGGYPVVVPEATLLEAHRLARAETGAPVCATGTAGLAGLVELLRSGAVAPDERVAVVFTGRER